MLCLDLTLSVLIVMVVFPANEGSLYLEIISIWNSGDASQAFTTVIFPLHASAAYSYCLPHILTVPRN